VLGATLLERRCLRPRVETSRLESAAGSKGGIPDQRDRAAFLSRCHAALNSRNHACLFSILFREFNCIVTALKSRTVAPKTRTKFLLKFVRDISTKITLSFFRASVSVHSGAKSYFLTACVGAG
jgi:hypothetical protein